MATFILNAWYVAAVSEDVSNDEPLGRKVCNFDIAFFRNADGKIQAVEDFCPHRGAPLSLGKVVNGNLVCGYHGLQMAGSGNTHSMPKQRVDKFPCIRSFPVVEKFGFIWIWPGDPQKAAEEKLPNLQWADNPDWAYGGGLFHIQCDYRLMIDNLMDLTHETYVHASSIGQKEIDEVPVQTTVEKGQVVTSRHMENISAPPFWQAALRANDLQDDGPIDRWQICRFDLPSHVMIEVGVAYAGKGGYDAPENTKVGSWVVDFITPETDSSIWYFWGMARNFKVDDPELTKSIRDGQGKIFTEDQEILERQQLNLDKYKDKRILKLDIDAGGVQARRMIERAIKKEAELHLTGDLAQ
ncbi:vanillate O-demethylase oxygenase subunit (4-hydroxy-3-methoxybenzoate demethylase) [Alteromonas sp. 38]|uniref:aromatic ring-hydroxylating dioxygenase subunit alpha n=1 Tax=unclassified Alteromonas TaxID=2614992 RepID=UPI0012F01BC3|nr:MULTISPECIES: aromatic ring-hydroxylating dioxygenase subunit alpha [unclassified Alteromonas]CAD5254405.1 vanillate O-demethylase oxygenase subunit (4-hydroxy-3-methoxybenzoate demethylase) [Alteromonas sp. 154]VXB04298.1 vanillate O-demethylase oxygenase subunit (4-hydroxy-3-methoxybenzoate demethylase) [Alteromonas sp. 38]